MAGGAFAQGNVAWNTIGANAFTVQTNATVISPLFGGGASGIVGATVGNTANVATTFSYELLYLGGSQVSAPTTLAALAGWSDAGLSAVNSGTGRASVSGAQTSQASTVPWAAGTTDNIVLVGWSDNLGLLGNGTQTYANVLNVLNNWNTGGVYNPVAGQNYFFGISTAGYESPTTANPGPTILATAPNATGTPIFSLLTQLDLLPVPEPGTLALCGLGGLALALIRRQRK